MTPRIFPIQPISFFRQARQVSEGPRAVFAGFYGPGLYESGFYGPGFYEPGLYEPGFYGPGFYPPKKTTEKQFWVPDSLALLWLALFFALCSNSNAQTGPKVGVSAGYAVQEAQIPQSMADPALQALPGHNAYVGLDLRFPLSDDAELRTGFRLRNQTTTVLLNLPGSEEMQRDDFSVVEIPLGFGLKRALGQRWTIRQVYAFEMQVLGSGSSTEPISPLGPVFQVLAQPQKHIRAALSVQGELGYCTSSNFCVELHASYHQGITGSQEVAAAVLRNPDQYWVYPLMQTGSYFSTGLALSLPAGKIGRRPEGSAGL